MATATGRIRSLTSHVARYSVTGHAADGLRSHQGAADAAVAGRPSTRWGETVVAYVVAADAVDATALERELAGWCAERLAPYKRPRAWRWIGQVPRNALGKALRRQLP